MYEKEEDKERDKKMLEEINKMTDDLNKIKDVKEKEDERKELEINISEKKELYTIFEIVHNKQFQEYLKGFNDFYNELSPYLDKKFFNNENFNENDVILFEQFIFTLSNYNFMNIDYNYIEIWKESFEEISIKEIESSLNNYNKIRKQSYNFKLVNNNKDIQMICYGNIFLIKNIYKYSIDRLISYFYIEVK